MYISFFKKRRKRTKKSFCWSKGVYSHFKLLYKRSTDFMKILYCLRRKFSHWIYRSLFLIFWKPLVLQSGTVLNFIIRDMHLNLLGNITNLALEMNASYWGWYILNFYTFTPGSIFCIKSALSFRGHQPFP